MGQSPILVVEWTQQYLMKMIVSPCGCGVDILVLLRLVLHLLYFQLFLTKLMISAVIPELWLCEETTWRLVWRSDTTEAIKVNTDVYKIQPAVLPYSGMWVVSGVVWIFGGKDETNEGKT